MSGVVFGDWSGRLVVCTWIFLPAPLSFGVACTSVHFVFIRSASQFRSFYAMPIEAASFLCNCRPLLSGASAARVQRCFPLHLPLAGGGGLLPWCLISSG
jgi:hypothetical protein